MVDETTSTEYSLHAQRVLVELSSWLAESVTKLMFWWIYWRFRVNGPAEGCSWWWCWWVVLVGSGTEWNNGIVVIIVMDNYFMVRITSEYYYSTNIMSRFSRIQLWWFSLLGIYQRYSILLLLLSKNLQFSSIGRKVEEDAHTEVTCFDHLKSFILNWTTPC